MAPKIPALQKVTGNKVAVWHDAPMHCISAAVPGLLITSSDQILLIRGVYRIWKKWISGGGGQPKFFQPGMVCNLYNLIQQRMCQMKL